MVLNSKDIIKFDQKNIIKVHEDYVTVSNGYNILDTGSSVVFGTDILEISHDGAIIFKSPRTGKVLAELRWTDGKIDFKGKRHMTKAARAFFERLIMHDLKESIDKHLQESLTKTNVLNEFPYEPK